MPSAKLNPDTGKIEYPEDQIRPIYSGHKNDVRVLPANQVYGEGLFFAFDSEKIKKWTQDNNLEEYYSTNLEVDSMGEFLNSEMGLYGRAKFYLLHTFSHLIMKELEFSCGYPTASLSERLYYSDEMCGVLIYTADGAEGSMGGLVWQGQTDRIERIILSALERAQDCSSDPLCWENNDGLNKAACFSCAMVSETSCERFNMGLDRRALVKNWGEPTGESYSDHLATWFANMFGGESAGIDGCRLPCGHFIPKGTFPIERYNGCPFCGTQFATSDFVYMGQGTELKVLRLFTDEDMKNLCKSLLESVTPLDATQRDTLELLLAKFPLPDELNIRIRETVMLVIKLLVEQGRAEEAGRLMNTPTDVLRYLWFEKTGLLQIIEPKTLIANVSKMYSYLQA